MAVVAVVVFVAAVPVELELVESLLLVVLALMFPVPSSLQLLLLPYP